MSEGTTEQTTETPATERPTEQATEQTTETQGVTETALGGRGAEEGSKTGDGEGGEGKPDSGSEDGAPESYEAFTLPEGYEPDNAMMELATGVFKEMNLSQKSAQRLIDLQVKQMEAQASEFQATQKEWMDELKNDAEIGGKNWEGNVAKAREFLTQVAGDDAKDLMDFFNTTGYGNFPPLFRFVLKLAQGVSEDSMPGRSRTTDKDSEEALLRKRYPSMFKEAAT